MARCPFAQWKPLARAAAKADCDKTQIIVHTMSGHFLGSRATFEKSQSDSTFMLALDGELHQLMESQKQANANRESNRRAISIETEDGTANDAIIERTPWTREQVLVLIKLIRWCAKAHGIPLVRIADPTAPGIGYHMMFRSRYRTRGSNPWAKDCDKICPGKAREHQFETVILPELTGHRKLTLEPGAPPSLLDDGEDADDLRAPGGESFLASDAGLGLWGTRTRVLDRPADAYRIAAPTVYTRDKYKNLRAPALPPEVTSIRRTPAR